VVSGSEQRALAQSRLDRSSLLPTVRGAITDRKGRVLAESVPSYDLAVFYPAINGTWASTRAIAAAKKEAGRAAWNKLGPADREERIAAIARALYDGFAVRAQQRNPVRNWTAAPFNTGG
jgi:cell division protein FtsI/penicillin-binding protein 2